MEKQKRCNGRNGYLCSVATRQKCCNVTDVARCRCGRGKSWCCNQTCCKVDVLGWSCDYQVGSKSVAMKCVEWTGCVAMADRCCKRRWTYMRSVAIAGRMMQEVAMVDRMLQDAGGCRVATWASEWTTTNGATPKYGSYHLCCNKPTATCASVKCVYNEELTHTS